MLIYKTQETVPKMQIRPAASERVRDHANAVFRLTLVAAASKYRLDAQTKRDVFLSARWPNRNDRFLSRTSQ